MGYLRRFRGKLLWAPVGALVAVGALLAGTVFASASAPNLPKRTPAQLLAAMRHATLPPAMTAVISESANLGFPALPDIAGLPSSALSAASWLAGSHTVQIWYSGPQHIRIAVPVSFGETDLRVNGNQAWLWQSHGQVATHIIIAPPAGTAAWQHGVVNLGPPQGGRIQRMPARMARLYLQKLRAAGAIGLYPPLACPKPDLQVPSGPAGWKIIKNLGNNGGGFINIRAGRIAPARLRALVKFTYSQLQVAPPGVAAEALKAVTPLQAAQRLLALVGPTTKVTIAGTTVVAGHSAYQLSIVPRTNQSLIGQILIAVDAKSFLPLQVQVIPRGSSSPAFQVGFTSLTPGQPAASNFTFTPPPGAHVKVVKLPDPLGGLVGPVGLPGMIPGPVGLPSMTPPRMRLKIIKSLHVNARPGWHVGTNLPMRMLKLHGHVRLWSPNGRLALGCIGLQQPAQAPLTAVGTGPQVLGSGWLSVAVIPLNAAMGSAYGYIPSGPSAHHSRLMFRLPGAGGQLAGMLGMLLNSATPVHGSWGSGKLITTRLLNILITSKGQALIGAVTPAVLFADAAKVK